MNTSQIRYEIFLKVAELGNITPEVDIELTNGTYRDIEDRIRDGRLDCGFLSAIENDPLDFTPLLDDPMLVITAPDHPLSIESCLCAN